jgi:L-rhamnose mutarotase
MKINPVLFLQADVSIEYMRQHNLAPQEFVALDKKHNILHFLEIGYEPFHLTGTQGVVEEVEAYIQRREAAMAAMAGKL